MTSPTAVDDVALAIVDRIDGGGIVLRPPGTEYKLSFVLDGAGSVGARPVVGKRVRGRIEGEALRVHAVAGGGRFVEPISGEPRIVAGTVRAIDQEGGRVLVETVVPMWLSVAPGQEWGVFELGGLVSGYVKSGMRFRAIR